MTTRRTFAAILLAFGLAGFLASPHIAFSQRSEAGQDALKFLDATAVKGGLTGAVKPDDYSSESAVLGVIGNIVNVILGFVGIIFFVQLFYAGFRWMSSGGNEEVVTESRQTIKNSVIGIVVVFAAFVITNFTLNQIKSITGQGPAGPAVTTYCKYYDSRNVCKPMDPDTCVNDIGGEVVTGEQCDAGTCKFAANGSECAETGQNKVNWTGRLDNISQASCQAQVALYTEAGCQDEYEWTPNRQ